MASFAWVMSYNFSNLRVTLAHHWLVGMRGGEKVLEQICQVFPRAPILTLVATAGRLSERLRSHPIYTSHLQQLGGASHYKKMLPIFPAAVASLRVQGPVDLLISSDASVIKGLSYSEATQHVCYCHSPPRYLWDRQGDYMQSSEAGGRVGRAVFSGITPYVREFDRTAARRVTHFIANSKFVRDRIKTCYGRTAEVIHPPVYLHDFTMAQQAPEDFYLIVSQLTPYKRIDIAVAAFNELKRKLVVIGEGSERARLQAMAGPSITFLGSQPLPVLSDHYRRCRAFIFPGVEDFGITPLEAQASGRPVIAFREGGVLETVIDGATGLFFDQQTSVSLVDAILRFEKTQECFAPANCRKNAERFSPDRFRHEIAAFVGRCFNG